MKTKPHLHNVSASVFLGNGCLKTGDRRLNSEEKRKTRIYNITGLSINLKIGAGENEACFYME